MPVYCTKMGVREYYWELRELRDKNSNFGLLYGRPDEHSDPNLKMKRRDFCLEFFCQFFGSGLPSPKLQAKVVLLFLRLKLL